MNNQIWSNSKKLRLEAAREINEDDLQKILEALCQDCPVTPWPHGNATSINPLLVTLGASPGNSPSADDTGFLNVGSHPLPTAGTPHPGTHYCDTAGYWDKLRYLVRVVLTPTGGSEDDALALFGNVNLDTGRSAEARNVSVDLKFASWVLETIKDRFKPRFLVLLGLSGYLAANPEVSAIFERNFSGFKSKKPHREVRFAGYPQKILMFREWDVLNGAGDPMTIVMWPQHPSRAPFSNSNIWRASCNEFSDRYGHLID